MTGVLIFVAVLIAVGIAIDAYERHADRERRESAARLRRLKNEMREH